jgi:hypothetical protein
MMMMMGLGRPKIRNDGSPPGPRSSSRATPLLLFFTLSLLPSLSLYFLQYKGGMIIIALLRDHDLLSQQLNASRLKAILPICFYCTPVISYYPFCSSLFRATTMYMG